MRITKDFFENLYLYDGALVRFSLKDHYRDMLVTFYSHGNKDVLFKGVVSYNYTSQVRKQDFSMDDIYLNETLLQYLYGTAFHWGICANIITNWTLEEDTEELKMMADEFGYPIYKFSVFGNYGTLVIYFIDVVMA